jgi:hypothetical protein
MYIHRVTKNVALFAIKFNYFGVTEHVNNHQLSVNRMIRFTSYGWRSEDGKQLLWKTSLNTHRLQSPRFDQEHQNTEWSVIFTWNPPAVYRLCDIKISVLSVICRTRAPCSDEPVYTPVTFLTRVDNLPFSAVSYTGHCKACVDILFKWHDSNLHAIKWHKKRLILVGEQLDVQFFYNMFIWFFYMFRATMCSSSGGHLY